MKIGYYVRTINGKIWIIKSQQAISGHKKDIINYSPNIIDLIEVGDYVNGKRVTDIDKDKRKIYIEEMYYFTKKDIESIVTKEQFSQIKYKVGD